MQALLGGGGVGRVGLVWSRRAGWDCGESLGEGRRGWSLVDRREDNSGSPAGEIILLRLYQLRVCAYV